MRNSDSTSQPENGWNGQQLREYGQQVPDPGVRSFMLALADFLERRGGVVRTGDFDLFGFGNVECLAEAENTIWLRLLSLPEPSGIDSDELVAWWRGQVAAGYDDVDTLPADGVTHPLISLDGAVQAIHEMSPWREEFFNVAGDLLMHGALQNGLAEELLGAEGARELARRLPPEEEARAKAWRGPGAGLLDN